MEEARGDAGLRLVLIALAATALLAGCGDGGDAGGPAEPLTKTQYEKKVAEIAKSLEQSSKDAQAAFKTDPAKGLEKTGDGLGKLAEELRRLKPPTEIRSAHRDFVASLDGAAAHLRKSSDVYERDGAEAAIRFATDELAEDVRAKNLRARRIFKEKGYDIGDVQELTIP